MKVIHFCTYYVGSKVYERFFAALYDKNIEQKVFIPIRRSSDKNKNRNINDDVVKIKLIHVHCLSILTKISYFIKVFFVFIASLTKIGRSRSYGVVHAHTLYADGIPAFLYSKLTGKKLVITLRNTDVNLGFRFFVHYKWLARFALSYSSKIIFVSVAHQNIFLNYFGDEYKEKLVVCPNGIDDYFIENSLLSKEIIKSYVGLYVGSIDKNKNILNAIISFFHVNKNRDWRFIVLGGSYKDFCRVYGEIPPKIKANVTFIEKTSDKKHLSSIYDQASVFIMPSYLETFGLVYIEAISRCIPVVYTKGQGIDGIFDDNTVGFSCEPDNSLSIESAIEKTQELFPNGLGPFKKKNICTRFSWNIIARDFVEGFYK
ncbi:glycosyltransferase family 4 protein [Vibrio splendidus]